MGWELYHAQHYISTYTPRNNTHFALHTTRKGVFGKNQLDISTGKLNTLLYVHTRPINVMVYHGPNGENLF
jgi:hypothetical protein